MAIALVPGQNASAQSATSAASIAVSFAASVGAGHLIVTKVSVDEGNTVSNCQMTGETFAAAVQLDATDVIQRIECWKAFNTAGGQTQVTANFNASATFRSIGITEWSGVQTSPDPLDQTAAADHTGTAGAAISSPDKTPGVNGELIWGAVCCGTGTPAVNSPYTLIEAEATNDTGSEYQIQGTAAAVHTDFNLTGNTTWGVIMATFKPATAAAAYVPYDLPHSRGFQPLIAS